MWSGGVNKLCDQRRERHVQHREAGQDAGETRGASDAPLQAELQRCLRYEQEGPGASRRRYNNNRGSSVYQRVNVELFGCCICPWLSYPFSHLNFTLVRIPGRCRMKKQSELNGEEIEVVKRFGTKTQVRLKASNRILVVDTHGVRFEGARWCPLHVWCVYTMKL